MKKVTSILGMGLLLAAATAPGAAGKFYGLHWDGSAEHFVSLDPYTAVKTEIAVIPNVRLIDAFFRVFEPDSSRYAFVGGATQGAMQYQVIDAPTGGVVTTFPRTEGFTNPVFSPGDGKLYGLTWKDSSISGGVDSLGRPRPPVLRGMEYFTTVDISTGARTDVAIPGVKFVHVNSHFLNTDSGRYVFAASGPEGNTSSHYYVIDVASGGLVAKLPYNRTLRNPVYDPALQAVHGLWWSDSTPLSPGDSGYKPSMLTGTEYFVTIHADSTESMVALPGVKYITMNFALDSDNQRYLFVGRPATVNEQRYYVVDVVTGAILSQTALNEKIDHIVYAPAASTVDSAFTTAVTPARPAKTWGMRAGSPGVVELSFSNPSGVAHALSLHTLSGATLRNVTGIRANMVRIETAGMRAGVYFFRLSNAKGVAAEGKLTVQ